MKTFIEKPIYNIILSESIHHDGLMDVAMRFTEFAGPYLHSGQAKFIDIVLSQAITNWSLCASRDGIRNAYGEFCLVVFQSLSRIFDYTVTGKTKTVPHYNQTWDCTAMGFFQWVKEHSVDLEKLTVQYTPASHKLDAQAASYILSSRVFTRNDMVHLGLSSDIHVHTGR